MVLKKKNKKANKEENIENKEKDTVNNSENSSTINENNNSAENSNEENSDKSSDVLTKIAEMQEKYLRLSAEFDNYRKRTLKEKSDLLKTAGEDILIKLLPVVDDFNRALKMIDSAKDIESVKTGIMLIHNKFNEFLTQRGVKPIESINQVFDTDMHEALTKVPAQTEDQKGKVIDEIEKGYFLYDKVIRFSKVVVGE